MRLTCRGSGAILSILLLLAACSNQQSTDVSAAKPEPLEHAQQGVSKVESTPAKTSEMRSFEFVYTIEIPAIAKDSGPVDVWVPIAQSNTNQQITEYSIEADIPGEEEALEAHGNRVWHGRLEHGSGEAITIRSRYKVDNLPKPKAEPTAPVNWPINKPIYSPTPGCPSAESPSRRS